MNGVPHIHNNTLITMNEIVHSLTQKHTQYHHDPDGWCTTHTQQHTYPDECDRSLTHTDTHTVAS